MQASTIGLGDPTPLGACNRAFLGHRDEGLPIGESAVIMGRILHLTTALRSQDFLTDDHIITLVFAGNRQLTGRSVFIALGAIAT